MEGTAKHRRRGKETISYPIYVAVRFTPERTLAQVIIDNKEGYNVGQKYESGPDATTVIPLKENSKGPSKLASFGLRPEDLTMTFMFWKFKEELKNDSVRGRECRVFLLEAPGRKHKAKVYISSEYFFPLKIEWFSKNQDAKSAVPERTGKFDSFRKEGKFWLVTTITLNGPGWRTKINFDKTKAGYSDEYIPARLFRKLKSD